MQRVMQAVDKANGYCFGDAEHRSLQALMSAAVGADFHFTSYPFFIVFPFPAARLSLIYASQEIIIWGNLHAHNYIAVLRVSLHYH